MKMCFKAICKSVLVASMVLCTSFFCGCSDEKEPVDGPGDPIQLTINGIVCKDNTYNVLPRGGQFNLYSKNYGKLYVATIEENEVLVFPSEGTRSNDFLIEKEWYDVHYNEEGEIVVRFWPMQEGDSSRSLTLIVRHINTFRTIKFIQGEE